MADHKSLAHRNHQKFYGRKTEKQTSFEFTMPKAVTFLGEGEAIEYRSDKKTGARTGRMAVRKKRVYRHIFGPGVKIYLHPNRKWLLITGGKFRVTDWMRG